MDNNQFNNYIPINSTPRTSGKAIASMICGISSLIGICPYLYFIGIALAIVAIVLGFKAKNDSPIRNMGMSVAGRILGFIVLGLYVVILVIVIITMILGGGLSVIEELLNGSYY